MARGGGPPWRSAPPPPPPALPPVAIATMRLLRPTGAGGQGWGRHGTAGAGLEVQSRQRAAGSDTSLEPPQFDMAPEL